MTSDPIILVLDDERSQLLTVRAQLIGLGTIHDFSEPEAALAFAREHLCDVAIVDVRMPRCSMDGLDFARALRQQDEAVAVIFRTADESLKVADTALEVQASRRAVKSCTTRASMRGFVTDAISETRAKRKLRADASSGEKAREQLLDAIGVHDLKITAGEVYRSTVLSLLNLVSSASVLAEALKVEAQRGDQDSLTRLVDENATLINRMVTQLNAFLDSPFAKAQTSSDIGVNEVMSALREHFSHDARWLAADKRVKVKLLIDNAIISSPPLRVLNVAKHLVEYWLHRVAEGSEVILEASLSSSAESTLSRQDYAFVLNRDVIVKGYPVVILRVAGVAPSIATEEIKAALTFSDHLSESGNLTAIAALVTEQHGAVAFSRHRGELVSLELLLPVAQ